MILVIIWTLLDIKIILSARSKWERKPSSVDIINSRWDPLKRVRTRQLSVKDLLIKSFNNWSDDSLSKNMKRVMRDAFFIVSIQKLRRAFAELFIVRETERRLKTNKTVVLMAPCQNWNFRYPPSTAILRRYRYSSQLNCRSTLPTYYRK